MFAGYYNGGGGGDYASNGYSSYDRARPYGPPQSVSIPSGSYGGYDSYDSHGLDWGSSGYGGGGGNGGHGYNNIWADKFNVSIAHSFRFHHFFNKKSSIFLASFQIEFSADSWCSADWNSCCTSCKSGLIAIRHCYRKTTSSKHNIKSIENGQIKWTRSSIPRI